MNFVHFGAGAGDLDPSSNFRDGFSEYIKNQNGMILFQEYFHIYIEFITKD